MGDLLPEPEVPAHCCAALTQNQEYYWGNIALSSHDINSNVSIVLKAPVCNHLK